MEASLETVTVSGALFSGRGNACLREGYLRDSKRNPTGAATLTLTCMLWHSEQTLGYHVRSKDGQRQALLGTGSY